SPPTWCFRSTCLGRASPCLGRRSPSEIAHIGHMKTYSFFRHCRIAALLYCCALFGVARTTVAQSTPSFAKCDIRGVGAKPIAIAAGDFNRDSHPDLAVIDAGNNQVLVYLTDPQLFSIGDCQQAVRCPASGCSVPIGSGPVAIAAADIDG